MHKVVIVILITIYLHVASGRLPRASSLYVASRSAKIKEDAPLPKKRRLLWIPDGFKNALASGFASVMVKSLLQPLDTIKTMQQIDKVPSGVIKTSCSLIQQRGFGALWAGLGVTAFGSAPSIAMYFGVFSEVKKHLVAILPKNYRYVAVGTAALVGNTFASILRVPYEGMHDFIPYHTIFS